LKSDNFAKVSTECLSHHQGESVHPEPIYLPWTLKQVLSEAKSQLGYKAVKG